MSPTVGGTPKPGHRHVLVTIPCLDEERTVAEIVSAVPREIEGVSSVEVVVLDDGSQDATGERAREAGATVLRSPQNLGLGRTFQRGVRYALAESAEMLVNIDGDGQFDPKDIPALIEPLLQGEAHMVTASRFLDKKLVPKMPWLKRWGNRWVARIVWILTSRRYRDVSCGFRAFSREALLRMNLFGSFTYTQETFLDLLFKGLPIREVPVRVRGTREYGRSRVASSIVRYAFRSLRIMLRAAISYRPFRFFATIAIAFFAAGSALLGFLLWHYLKSGAFSPHIWAGFVGGSLFYLGLLTMIIGFVGDMLVRIRMNQEEMLYFLKSRHYGDPLADPSDS